VNRVVNSIRNRSIAPLESAFSFPVFQAPLNVRLENGYDIVGVSLVTVHMLSPVPVDKENNIQGQRP
jgi:hypothetical protein